jgi:hypothetical protein
MHNEFLIANLIAALVRLNDDGDSWKWDLAEIANVAIRRWQSFARRHRKVKRATEEDRVTDLVKGLQAHFEPDIPFTHPADWRALAQVLARELEVCER